MFKVSFKDDFKKVQRFNDRATVVTLTGRVAIPSWDLFPNKIQHWIWDEQDNVDVQDNLSAFIIIAKGKTVRADGDADNPVIAERIAEARAKLKIYKFMYKLCEKLLKYNFLIMYGNSEGGRVTESHEEPPRDCVWLALKKYRELMIKESHHLGKLLEEA